MEQVDFSQAKLIGVSFTHGIELSNCKFPVSSEYIFIEDIAITYERAILEVETKWVGEHKTHALSLLKQFYYNDQHKNQKNDFIDKHILFRFFDIEFSEKFFDLIKEVN